MFYRDDHGQKYVMLILQVVTALFLSVLCGHWFSNLPLLTRCLIFHLHEKLQFIRAKKTLDHHKEPSSSTLNDFYNGKTVEDQLVPEIEVSKASYFQANQPVADEMSPAFFANDPFIAEFPLSFASELMGNAPRLGSMPSFESFENLSLDDFE